MDPWIFIMDALHVCNHDNMQTYLGSLQNLKCKAFEWYPYFKRPSMNHLGWMRNEEDQTIVGLLPYDNILDFDHGV